MKRTCTLILMILSVLILCTSCWNRRELDDLAIVKAVGFDKDGEDYAVTVQIINPQELIYNAAGYDTPVTIYQTTGKTVVEAIRKLTEEMPRKAYFSHLRVAIISEELARAGLIDVVDALRRDHEMRSDFYFIVTKGDRAMEVLRVLTPLEVVPANKLFHSLEAAEKAWGSAEAVTLDELVDSLTSVGRQLVLPGLDISGPPKEGEKKKNVETTNEIASLIYSGLAIFNEDQLIGWLTDEESKSYNFIESNIESTIINVPCQDGSLGIEVFNTKSKVKGVIKENKPVIKVDINVFGNINDVECRVDLEKLEEFTKIEHDAQLVVKNDIERVIQKVQKEFKVDIFGFGDAIYRAAPKEWKSLKENWDREFEDLTVDIHVNVNLKHEGTTRKSMNKVLKEK